MSNKARIWLYKEGNECSTITGGWGNCINNGAHSSKFVKKSTYMASDAYGVNRWIAISTINKLNSDLIYNITVEYDLKQVSTTTGNEIVMTTNMSNWSTMDANIKYRDTFTPTVLGKGSKTSTTVNISNQEGYITIKNSWGSVYFCGVYITTKEEVISIVNQDNISLSFNLNNMNNKLSFTQIDILTNGNVIQSYTGNLSEITYEFDKALMDLGDNEISIQATYTQGDNIYEIAELISDIHYKKEVVLEELDPIVDLPSTSTLKEVMQRFSVIESTNKAIRNNLKTLLEAKGFSVGDTPRLSNMVKLVNELSNNNSTEITEYINRITALESEVDDNKRNLYNVLVNKGVTDIATASTFEQLIDLVSTRLALIETKRSVLMDTTYINSNGKFLNHTKTIITGYDNTAGFSIVGTQPNYVGANYMSGRLRCDFVIDFTDITSVSFFAKKVAQHGIVSVWISDGLPNNVLEENFTDHYASVRTGYGVTNWTVYSMDTSNITGIKTLSFVGGYVDYTGNSASRTDYSNIILNYN